MTAQELKVLQLENRVSKLRGKNELVNARLIAKAERQLRKAKRDGR